MSADELTHASFFSGVGGLDLGLERAGWRTVSFSEIDPYASAVLAQRWPGVPNLGDIVQLASSGGSGPVDRNGHGAGRQHEQDDWRSASLWSGGFPCQDLSVAGKRRGMVEGTRSNLAYSFLALAERHRPRFVLLENVPGLLSSHGGRDMAALLGALVELGYGVGYRIVDARYFGVPQRRRRVFILGDSLGGRAGAERASEVLSVGSRCRRHPPTGVEAGEGAAAGPGESPLWSSEYVGPVDGAMGHHGVAYPQQSVNMGHIRVSGPIRAGGNRLTRQELDDIPSLIAGTIREHVRPGSNTDHTVLSGPPHDAGGQGRRGQGSAPLGGHEPDDGHLPDPDAVRRAERPEADPDGVRAPDGLAGRVDGSRRLAATLNSGGNNGGFRTEPGEHLVYVKRSNVRSDEDAETWEVGDIASTVAANNRNARELVRVGSVMDDPMLPLGLDSHRYRCCGNGVVADVGEWIGTRLMEIA